MMTSQPDPPAEAEYLLKPYRRPVRFGEVLGLVLGGLFVFVWVAGGLVKWAGAPRGLALGAGGAVVAALLAWWWRVDHRAYPAGRLRIGPESLTLDDGRRVATLGYGELRDVMGTNLSLVLRGAGRRLRVDWQRFDGQPREVVHTVLARVSAHPEGPRILAATAAQTRRASGMRRILFWVLLVNGVLLLLRLILGEGR